MTEVVGGILDSHWQTPIGNATASEATNHMLSIVSPSILCTTLPYLTLCKGPRAFANQLLMTAQAFDVASPKELHKAENNPRLRPSTTLNTPTCPGDLQALSGISHHPLSIFLLFTAPLAFTLPGVVPHGPATTSVSGPCGTTLRFFHGALLFARSCHSYLNHIEVATGMYSNYET